MQAMTEVAEMIFLLRFQTPRLVVSPLISRAENRAALEAELADIAAMLTPAVVEHLPEPLHLTDGPDRVGDWVVARQSDSALLAVREAGAGRIMGLLIVADTSELDATPTLRLGYLFSELVWGRGYATELVSGLIRELGKREWSGQIVAGVSSTNPGSSRVLLKSGFMELPDAPDPQSRDFRRELP